MVDPLSRSNASRIRFDNDPIRDAVNSQMVLRSLVGRSSRRLGLNNDPCESDASLGAECRVQTVEGVTYTLTLDHADELGLDTTDNAIEVYVDGVRIEGQTISDDDKTLPEKVGYQFNGNGQHRTIRAQLRGDTPLPDVLKNLHIIEALFEDLRGVGIVLLSGWAMPQWFSRKRPGSRSKKWALTSFNPSLNPFVTPLGASAKTPEIPDTPQMLKRSAITPDVPGRLSFEAMPSENSQEEGQGEEWLRKLERKAHVLWSSLMGK